MNKGPALSGSQRWLQLAVNRCPNVIDAAIARAIGLEQGETIRWVSPLESDAFVEYKDQEFLDRLGISPQHRRLKDFWPALGPVWDGLAQTSGGRYLLLEAKANIPEFDSSPSKAESESSLLKIGRAFDDTKTFLRIRRATDWSNCFYQYANRLAHLYFLRELNKVNATLVFIYFIDDTTRVPDAEPVSRDGWQAAISLALHHLGIRTSFPWVRDNVADVFVDVNDLSHVPWP